MDRFTNIEWKNTQCHLCGATSGFEPLLLHGKPLKKGQFEYDVHPVICRCGLVFLNPRWSDASFGEFYEKYYDELYRLELKPDYGIEGVVGHMAQVWSRIKPYLVDANKMQNVLDVGCGSGYGLKYLKEQLPGIMIHGIEASPGCREILTEKIGAVLLDSDVDGPWLHKNKGRFDLIIMRHVVEHLLSPIETLSRLKTALTPGGMIYIAVPDMMHPRTVLRDYDNWWEYYFRAVHPYYYCRKTLFTTLEMAGIYPLAWGEENEEVWCLVTRNGYKPDKKNGSYEEQMIVLRQYLPGSQKI
ncbi:MAG: class I SAM-dependent methyltransferase [Desulfobacula sp.]|nr:class I SAM-dependent methyltransferase [Desulfobacula sp.]